jgi:hypothetical protein
MVMAIGALFVIGLVGLGVHHSPSRERARSFGTPAANPAQVEGSNATAPEAAPASPAPAAAPPSPAASPALTGPGPSSSGTGGSGLQAQGAGTIATGSGPIPNTGAPSMLIPGCLLLGLALGARRLVKKAA